MRLRLLLAMLLVTGCSWRPSFSDATINAANVGSRLPAGFLLGTATAAHQAEGGNDNDWTDWENTAFDDGTPHIAHGDVSGQAADSWNQFPADLQLMKQLGSNAYRFSVEWSRVEPQRGVFDDVALARYVDWATQLRANGIEPMVTLFHFTLPKWVAAQGGWTSAQTQSDFEVFVGHVAEAMGAQVDLWCTINEPNVYAIKAYLDGVWPPGVKDNVASAKVLAALMEAHARATTVLRSVDTIDADGDGKATMIGIAHHVRIFQPATDSLLDTVVADLTDEYFNQSVVTANLTGRMVLSKPGSVSIDQPIPGLQGSFDYLGLNYYSRDFVRASLSDPKLSTLYTPEDRPKTDQGWDIYPEGLFVLLKRFSSTGIPIIITENGMADNSTGERRAQFLKAHLYAVEQAISEGVPVIGYMHWSLLDNFEWADGWTPKFGLYHVNLTTFERTPSLAVPAYRQIALNAGLSPQ